MFVGIIVLAITLIALMLLDSAALRWGVDSRDLGMSPR
jgi:hypothetical protein